jgi:hypothetical protein
MLSSVFSYLIFYVFYIEQRESLFSFNEEKSIWAPIYLFYILKEEE